MPNARPLKERLIDKLDMSGDCWEFQGCRTDFGHGQISADRKNIRLRAHRVAWEIWKGPIPEGLCVLHKCDNPPCCNPEHLFLGTKKDNTRDMISKGRWKSPWVKGDK